jgi:hypothetical protein
VNQSNHNLQRFRSTCIGIVLVAITFSGCTRRDPTSAGSQKSVNSASTTSKGQQRDSVVAGADRDPGASTDEVPSTLPIADRDQGPSGPALGPQTKPASGTQSPNGTNSDGSASGPGIRDAGSKPAAHTDATSGKMLDPRAAESRSEQMIAEAEKAGEKGNSPKAFELAVGAWEITRVHTGDARCKELAGKALKLAEQFGEAANKASAGTGRRKAITVK